MSCNAPPRGQRLHLAGLPHSNNKTTMTQPVYSGFISSFILCYPVWICIQGIAVQVDEASMNWHLNRYWGFPVRGFMTKLELNDNKCVKIFLRFNTSWWSTSWFFHPWLAAVHRVHHSWGTNREVKTVHVGQPRGERDKASGCKKPSACPGPGTESSVDEASGDS